MAIDFKMKVSVKEIADNLVIFIGKMQEKIHNEYSEILYINHRGEGEITAQEKIRRDWEVFYFILSFILIWIERNLSDKDKLCISDMLLIRISEIFLNKNIDEIASTDLNDFEEEIVKRIDAYVKPLSSRDMKLDLTKCFFSIIWFDQPYNYDTTMPALCSIVKETYLADISLLIITFMKDLFNKYKIA